ncbi:MAG: molybdopterin-guanine dinucleotide biosynthesis protein B [Deltaproteobacteria bacterium]|nr:molybdopterin-guanine dinucleotide biosynthesis protein B [Deltaproteobacteria bacterium]
MPPVISVVGKSGAGKTTLIEKLIPEIKKRGYRVGVIKHAHHGYSLDMKGKDSWRHREAGADAVMVAAPGTIAMVKDTPSDSLYVLQAYFQDVDLVITEGYKKEDKPKIEVIRKSRSSKSICGNSDHLIAVVTDTEVEEIDVPRFGFDDVGPLAELIIKTFL